MPRGGRQAGAGRKKGSKNRYSLKLKGKIDVSILPHEILHGIAQGLPVQAHDPETGEPILIYPTFDDIKWACVAAAPYFSPKLSAQAIKSHSEHHNYDHDVSVISEKFDRLFSGIAAERQAAIDKINGSGEGVPPPQLEVLGKTEPATSKR